MTMQFPPPSAEMSFWTALSNADKQCCFDPDSEPSHIIETDRKHQLKAWHIQGPLQKNWDSLLPKINDEMVKKDVLDPQLSGEKSLHLWSLFLVGSEPQLETLTPAICALHRDIGTAKRVSLALKEIQRGSLRHLLHGYPIYYVQQPATPHEVMRTSPISSHNDRKLSLCGALISISYSVSDGSGSTLDRPHRAHATIGGVLMVDNHYYALTTASAFKSWPGSSLTTIYTSTGEGADTDEPNHQSKGPIDVLHGYTVRLDLTGQDTESRYGSPGETLVPQRAKHSKGFVHRTFFGANGVFPTGDLVMCNRDQGWALIPLTEPRHQCANVLELADGNQLCIRDFVEHVPIDHVVFATGQSPPSADDFLGAPCALVLPDSSQSSLVWAVRRASAAGDVGSWLIDARGRAFAMVAAVSESEDTAFCLPLAPVLANIALALKRPFAHLMNMPNSPEIRGVTNLDITQKALEQIASNKSTMKYVGEKSMDLADLRSDNSDNHAVDVLGVNTVTTSGGSRPLTENNFVPRMTNIHASPDKTTGKGRNIDLEGVEMPKGQLGASKILSQPVKQQGSFHIRFEEDGDRDKYSEAHIRSRSGPSSVTPAIRSKTGPSVESKEGQEILERHEQTEEPLSKGKVGQNFKLHAVRQMASSTSWPAKPQPTNNIYPPGGSRGPEVSFFEPIARGNAQNLGSGKGKDPTRTSPICETPTSERANKEDRAARSGTIEDSSDVYTKTSKRHSSRLDIRRDRVNANTQKWTSLEANTEAHQNRSSNHDPTAEAVRFSDVSELHAQKDEVSGSSSPLSDRDQIAEMEAIDAWQELHDLSFEAKIQDAFWQEQIPMFQYEEIRRTHMEKEQRKKTYSVVRRASWKPNSANTAVDRLDSVFEVFCMKEDSKWEIELRTWFAAKGYPMRLWNYIITAHDEKEDDKTELRAFGVAKCFQKWFDSRGFTDGSSVRPGTRPSSSHIGVSEPEARPDEHVDVTSESESDSEASSHTEEAPLRNTGRSRSSNPISILKNKSSIEHKPKAELHNEAVNLNRIALDMLANASRTLKQKDRHGELRSGPGLDWHSQDAVRDVKLALRCLGADHVSSAPQSPSTSPSPSSHGPHRPHFASPAALPVVSKVQFNQPQKLRRSAPKWRSKAHSQ